MAEVCNTKTEPSKINDGGVNNQKNEHDDVEPQDDEEEQPQQPVVPVVVRPKKSWANLATTTQNQQQEPTSTAKKSLLSIMAEEEVVAQANKEKKEEEDLVQQAIHASLASSTTSAPSKTEEDDIQLAIRLSMMEVESAPVGAAVPVAAAAAAAAPPQEEKEGPGLSEEEMALIEKALRDAEQEEAVKSIQLAMALQEEDNRKFPPSSSTNQGNVRTISRAEYNRQQLEGVAIPQRLPHIDNDHDDVFLGEAGYRINSNTGGSWTKVDQNTILGPNNEIRTKHDLELQGQANASRLQLDDDDAPFVGSKAFNSFKRTMQKKTVKGVATSGQGRAHADSEKTKQGALDSRVRIQVTKAINSGLIEKFNGCVKEGKEALVYHADKPSGKEYDVAVKVFKRIQEFRNRGQYVDGDPRYNGKDFSHAGGREQLDLWAEKEYRNLVRAYRANVPVPQPLLQKENVLFLRFLGQDCWPSPQLRELNMKKGSKKWKLLYEQTMTAIQLLYNKAKLVHGDLSEYNILVCPSSLLLHRDEEGVLGDDEVEDETKSEAKTNGEDSDDAKVDTEKKTRKQYENSADDVDKPPVASLKADDAYDDSKAKDVVAATDMANTTTSKDKATEEEDDDSLQIALIDFGQAVDFRHPSADELLHRDLLRVKQFFHKIGVKTINLEASIHYVKTEGAPLWQN